eukprot:10802034-Alexandrium_andersonii.AAC.1
MMRRPFGGRLSSIVGAQLQGFRPRPRGDSAVAARPPHRLKPSCTDLTNMLMAPRRGVLEAARNCLQRCASPSMHLLLRCWPMFRPAVARRARIWCCAFR